MKGDRKNILEKFEFNRCEWDKRIDEEIEKNRKGEVQLSFVDQCGNPITNVQVTLKQKTHDFKFGANLFMLEELESEEKNDAYKLRFRELFNYATLPFYWCHLEPERGKLRFEKNSPKIYRRPSPDLCLEYCRDYGIEPKLHCLNYDAWTPNWVSDNTECVKKDLADRIYKIAERYKDQIPTMEVINESLCGKLGKLEDRHGTDFFEQPDIVEWSFEQARKYLPNNHLIINEATGYIWGDAYRYNRSAYYMQIERALAKGATIDGIGMQFHMFYDAKSEYQNTRKFYDPKLLYDVMNQYSDFQLPLQITEITIPAYSQLQEDEDLQAEVIRNLYRIWFSHKNMEAIVYWNLVDGYAAFAPQGDMSFGENYFYGGLIRYDLSLKPAYHTLKKLINETWRTNLTINSGRNNQVQLRGFYGTYEVMAKTNDKSVTTSIHIKKDADNHFLVTI